MGKRAVRVAIVDDHPELRRMYARVLAEFGIEVRAVHSPIEILRLITWGERFDAVVVDVHMPEMSGVVLAERIGEVSEDQGNRIIFVSVDYDAAPLDRPFLAKPFTIPKFVESVRLVAAG